MLLRAEQLTLLKRKAKAANFSVVFLEPRTRCVIVHDGDDNFED
jgi:hypothetical protein